MWNRLAPYVLRLFGRHGPSSLEIQSSRILDGAVVPFAAERAYTTKVRPKRSLEVCLCQGSFVVPAVPWGPRCVDVEHAIPGCFKKRLSKEDSRTTRA